MRREIELLAPVGTWDMLEAVIAEGADAVYLGGKKYNMRLHRADANFDNAQLAEAVHYAHARKVKLYLTLNNLMTDDELRDAASYLAFLGDLRPDALIVQDLGLIKLIRDLGITIPLHASVMMNVHNSEMVRLLQQYGIVRIVFGRELSLAQISRICRLTGIEAEYFTHGDMCIAHSGQCMHSGLVFGRSSSRGRCMKPCRWPYKLVDRQTGRELPCEDPGPYKLAWKDMCLYEHLPEVVQAGVYSFKIEGRMRTADYMRQIIRLYRRAFDRYLADRAGYCTVEEDLRQLRELRVRDFSTCYAFKHPGASAVGYGGEREPRFFSQAVAEPGIPQMTDIQPTSLTVKPQLSVRVGDYTSFREALAAGADCIYIGGEAFPPASPWRPAEIARAVEEAGGRVRVIVATPRITMDRELKEAAVLFRAIHTVHPAGVMVANAGSLLAAAALSPLPIYADFPFNCFNSFTASLLQQCGVRQITLSPEAGYRQAAALCRKSPLAAEWLIHGGIPAMVSEHCVPAAILARTTKEGQCPGPCRDHAAGLLDSAGHIHPIFPDQHCRNHLLLGRDLCLLPFLPAICSSGVSSLRIEGQYYPPAAIGSITRIYRARLDALWADPAAYKIPETLLQELRAAGSRELSAGAFLHSED